MPRKWSSESTVLVSGGAGFIGAHLCRKLLSEGFAVICVDNLYSGNKSNIADLLDIPRFEFIRHDINFPLYVEVDYIFNLACPASPVHYQADPVQTTKTSVVGAINMLGLAKRTGARILQASTSEVYGDPLVHPQAESYSGNVNPLGPRACYDEGKRCAETLFVDYKRQHGVDIRIARIFNTYGPFMQVTDGRVISNFIVQALRGENITIYGEGLQTRSFCYCDDLVSGLIALMWNEGEYSPVNLGNPNEMTIRQLANLIIEQTDSSSQLIFCDLPQDDPVRRQPDISRARTRLGWEPKIDLETGLSKTIDYFKTKI